MNAIDNASGILNAIGVVDTPFAHDITGLYCMAALKVIEEHDRAQAATFVAQIVQDHLPGHFTEEMLLRHIETPHSWVDYRLYGIFVQLGIIYTEDASFPYLAGKKAVQFNRVMVKAIRFFPLKSIYRLVSLISNNFSEFIEMKVEERRTGQASIVISRKSREQYLAKVKKIVREPNLVHAWLGCDCLFTRGILEFFPDVMKKTSASINKEVLCEGRGDEKCVYEIAWQDRGVVQRIMEFSRTVLTLDHHFEMKKEINLLEYTIKERTRDIEEARQELEDANARLVIMQERLVEAEKAGLERQIMGGFAHEMRNSLAGAQLELDKLLDFRGTGRSVTESMSTHLAALVTSIENISQGYGVSEEVIAQEIIPHVREIYSALCDTQARLEGVSSDFKRGLGLTAEIASYARMALEERGCSPVVLAEVVSGCLERLHERIKSAGIEVETDIGREVVVCGSELHFYSIFENLIMNALQAIEEHGTDSGEKRIRIRGRKTAQGVIVTLSDTGPGIDPEKLPRIFEPFFTLSPGRGTGIGLALVRRLVKRYGGEIGVWSSKGRGTVFTLKFLAGESGSHEGN